MNKPASNKRQLNNNSPIYIVKTSLIEWDENEEIGTDVSEVNNIIGVYTTLKMANEIANRIQNREPVKGIDYERIAPFNECTITHGRLNETGKNCI